MYEITDNKINLVIDDKIIGYILYDEKVDYIVGSYIYVNPEERGKGYSSSLIKRFVEFSKNKDKKIVPICPVIKRVLESNFKEILR